MKHFRPVLVSLLISVFIGLPGISHEPEYRLIKPITKKRSKKRYVELPPWGYVPRKPNKQSRKGKKLYKKENCSQCHSIKGKGGELGPPLDGIGSFRGPEWLVDRLLDPEKQNKQFSHIFGNRPNIMPHPAIDKEDAKLIVDYMLTLPEPEGGFLMATHSVNLPKEKGNKSNKSQKQDKDSALRGAKLFYDMHCYTCHSLDGSRDRFGPDLAGLNDRISEKRLTRFLNNPFKSGFMKSQLKGLSKQDLEDLKSFLLTIPATKNEKK